MRSASAHRPLRVRGGFTLIEVLVGLVVASLALTAGFVTLGFVQDRAEAAERAAVTALELSSVRQLLTDWLGAAHMRSANDMDEFFGTEQTGATGLPDDLISFPTTARTPLSTGETVVGLYIDDDPTTPEMGLVAELTLGFIDVPRRIQLVPQAAGMSILYLPDTDGAVEWVEGWSGSARARAVEIVLYPAPGDSLPALLAYPLRVPLGSVR